MLARALQWATPLSGIKQYLFWTEDRSDTLFQKRIGTFVCSVPTHD
ncbi:hypothetical protein A0J51_02916 [Gluconobacter japonicus]|nr:hypothetical protein A0J51_02916 [Gluconobacter japonicus]